MSTTSTLNSVLAATTGSSSSEIDVTDAVAAVLYADRAPERAWQAQQATLAAQTTEIDQLQSESATLADQLSNLQSTSGALNSSTATSSNTSVVTASTAPGTAAGTHTVVVNSLATTAGAYSASVASSTTQLSAGSFTINSGGRATTVQVGSGNGTADTLTQLAATINGDSLGISASVVTDSSGSRLSLTATASGSAAGFTISQDNSGLDFTQPSTGADASLAVDGVPITSASNTVTGALSGVTLNLLGINTSNAPATLTVAPDTTGIESALSSFVSAYNTLTTDVNAQFAYNSATATAGPLAADSTIQSFQSDLLNSTNYAAASGTYQSLSSLGITTNADGTLTLDSSAVANAVANNPNAVQSFFQGDGTGTNGFLASLQSSLNIYTDPSQGAFTVDLSSISNENTDLTNETKTLEAYLATVQTNLTTEYNNADIALAQLPQTLKQLNALLNPNSSSNNS